jgi:predicted DNA-binding antitoxin AbrB/MazE fold protein
MTMRAIRMRVRDGRLEPLSDVSLPEGAEVTVDIDVQEDDRQAVIDALRASAGAWSDEAHPDLRTREDVVKFVRELRDGFERRL